MEAYKQKHKGKKNKCILTSLSRLTTYATENKSLENIISYLNTLAVKKDAAKFHEIEKTIETLVTSNQTTNTFTKRKRIRENARPSAKSFKITFKCDDLYVNSHIKEWNYFKEDEIGRISTLNGYTTIEVACKKQKSLSLSNKNMKIGDMFPIKIETNARRDREIKEYYWIKDVPHTKPIQAFSGVALKNDFKHKPTEHFLKDFLETPTKENAEAFLTLIKKDMDALKLQVPSECAITCMIFKHILCLKNLPNFKMISIDSKMRESILDVDDDFRFDFAFNVFETSIIIENKYKSQRNNEQIDAHACLYYRAYPQRLINYLKSISEKLPTTLICLGIGYTKESSTSIGMKYSIVNVNEIDLDGYKSKEFLSEMKTNKRSFKSLSHLNNI
jgi:hypothetical protein